MHLLGFIFHAAVVSICTWDRLKINVSGQFHRDGETCHPVQRGDSSRGC